MPDAALASTVGRASRAQGRNVLQVAIACGGTGGHLFPGLAVAQVLQERGVGVTLLISPKEVDQRAARSCHGVDTMVLPVAGWQSGTRFACLVGSLRSIGCVRKLLRRTGRWAVLGMGGFTTLPAALAALGCRCPVFLHESNAVPGRANRWLARWARGVMVGYEAACPRVHGRWVRVTGTPVRREIILASRLIGAARLERRARVLSSFGLDAERPVVLVVGGSQGAHPLNVSVLACLDRWSQTGVSMPQWIHLTGFRDEATVRAGYASRGIPATVMAFSDQVADLLLAATVVLSRAGASFLAELVAVGVPAVVVPFPAAADDHQVHNARCLAQTGAIRMILQSEASPERLAFELGSLLKDPLARERMRQVQQTWHRPDAAERVAEILLAAMEAHRAGGSVAGTPRAAPAFGQDSSASNTGLT